VEDTYNGDFWLECCGHMSEFSQSGWGSQRLGRRRRQSKCSSQACS
jgi:hypothetical protein